MTVHIFSKFNSNHTHRFYFMKCSWINFYTICNFSFDFLFEPVTVQKSISSFPNIKFWGVICFVLFFVCLCVFKIYLFIFRERGREGEREGEKHQCVRDINWLPLRCPKLGIWPATQACALTGNPTSDPLLCRPALNPLSHTSQNSSLFC